MNTQYKKTEVEFYSTDFSDKETRKSKISKRCPWQKQLQSFFGLINYLNKYSPRPVEITTCLSDLTKDGIPFLLGLKHAKVFEAANQEALAMEKFYHFSSEE